MLLETSGVLFGDTPGRSCTLLSIGRCCLVNRWSGNRVPATARVGTSAGPWSRSAVGASRLRCRCTAITWSYDHASCSLIHMDAGSNEGMAPARLAGDSRSIDLAPEQPADLAAGRTRDAADVAVEVPSEPPILRPAVTRAL